MSILRHCQQLGHCLFPPCYSIYLEPCWVHGVSVFCCCCVCHSFHNRLDLIRKAAFYWACYFFPSFSLFVSSSYKDEQVLFVLVQQTSDFVASLGWGLGFDRLLPFTFGFWFCYFSRHESQAKFEIKTSRRNSA